MPACSRFAALKFVLSIIVLTTDALKKSWNSVRGDHDAVVSKVGPGVLAGMNLGGSGLLSFSSLLCHGCSWSLEVADLLRPRLGLADFCSAFPFLFGRLS